eukprot:TRINITY_DN11491_c0_g2_i3.p1 TRINITY_DN11491_c0_g2~~TRINITY_DN11491_c0_g2_i3.p1  ORF type:complete len:130 (+),score=14.59 TRINITY_DN11491_c0_g2_i3:77-466(+)
MEVQSDNSTPTVPKKQPTHEEKTGRGHNKHNREDESGNQIITLKTIDGKKFYVSKNTLEKAGLCAILPSLRTSKNISKPSFLAIGTMTKGKIEFSSLNAIPLHLYNYWKFSSTVLPLYCPNWKSTKLRN